MKKLKSLRLAGFAFCLSIGVCIGMLVSPLYNVATSITTGRNLQTLSAPETKHTASLLKKYNLADINFIVKVDGTKVYVSPDYIGFSDHLYRETLVWDKSGKVVLFELMGKKVFGYNAEEKRVIDGNELANYTFYPTASDKNYASIKDITGN